VLCFLSAICPTYFSTFYVCLCIPIESIRETLRQYSVLIGHILSPFTLLRNFPEILKVTTLRGLNIIESPVAGFLPFRSFLSFTQNLPNPLTSTSSPDAREKQWPEFAVPEESGPLPLYPRSIARPESPGRRVRPHLPYRAIVSETSRKEW
jgi:hypothetical protein